MLADATPPAKSTHGFACSVGTALAELPPGEAAALQAMLDDRQAWPDRAIFERCHQEAAETQNRWYLVAAQTVGRHRNRNCRCFR